MMNQTSLDPRTVDRMLSPAPVIPVIRIDNPDRALALARTLLNAGLPVLEITLRSPSALESIRRIASELPQACVGAGTVLNANDFNAVAEAGAKFVISPGATAGLYDAARYHPDIAYLPAVATGSDIMLGMERGYRRFKFFPAEAAGGIPMLKSWAGPFAEVRFVPTGGINPDNIAAYRQLPNVITVGGSWMVPTEAVEAGDWARISELAGEAASAG